MNDFIFFFRLRDLHIDFNELDELPQELASLSRLRSLSASGNQLTTLPDVLNRLAALESLRLAGNAIVQASQMALVSLRRLDLRGNLIQGVADFSRLQVGTTTAACAPAFAEANDPRNKSAVGLNVAYGVPPSQHGFSNALSNTIRQEKRKDTRPCAYI